MTSGSKKRNAELLENLKKAVLRENEEEVYTYFMELLEKNPSELESFQKFCDELNKIKITVGRET